MHPSKESRNPENRTTRPTTRPLVNHTQPDYRIYYIARANSAGLDTRMRIPERIELLCAMKRIKLCPFEPAHTSKDIDIFAWSHPPLSLPPCGSDVRLVGSTEFHTHTTNTRAQSRTVNRPSNDGYGTLCGTQVPRAPTPQRVRLRRRQNELRWSSQPEALTGIH